VLALVAVTGITLSATSTGQTEAQEGKKVVYAKCKSARKAIKFYRQRTWETEDVLNLSNSKTHYPERWATNCTYVRFALNRWVDRSAKLWKQYLYEYDWQTWLPAVWKAIISCETHYNFEHNSGTYEGAFGFHEGSWDSFKLPGYPSAAFEATPREQYNVALAIHSRFGFSGWGCAR
jgi:hypothetical protein